MASNAMGATISTRCLCPGLFLVCPFMAFPAAQSIDVASFGTAMSFFWTPGSGGLAL
jgi:hypothetical protein